MKNFFQANKKNYWFWAFVIIIIFIFFALPLLSWSAGNSGDEDFWQYPQSERIYNFYTTWGKDTTHKSVPEMNLYGMWFETLSYALCKAFHVDNYQTLRHVMNSLMGFIAILFAGLFAQRCKDWKAGTIVLLLLFLSPRFLGHSFNNPKDVPFAAMMMMGLYYIFRFIQTLPKPPLKICVMLAISIGLAIGIRAGGLLLVAYFGLFALCYILQIWLSKTSNVENGKNKLTSKQNLFSRIPSKLIGKIFIYGLTISIAGYILAVLLWPYALENPIKNVFLAFSQLSHYFVSLRQLFEGSLQWSDMLPWYYTPKYILISIPIAVIIGWLLYSFVGGWKKENRLGTFMLYFAFIFPVFWIVYSNANVYGGWRHAMFAYPPMAAAAGLGFSALVDWAKKKTGTGSWKTLIPYFLLLIPAILLIRPALHIIRNHPYEYVYFNELEGGMKNAYGNYEMDYYFHSIREAVEWVKQNVAGTENFQPLQNGQKVKVGTWHTASVSYFLRNDTANFQTVFVRWYERGNNDWDYAIFPITGIAPEQIKNEHFPPKNTVHTIKVDGKPICLILKRDDKSDLLGFQYKQKNIKDSAEFYLAQALAHDPYNDAALMNLIELYLQTGYLDSAKILIDRGFTYISNNETLLYFSAYYNLGKQETAQAIENCEQIIRNNFKFKGAYHLLTNIYLQKQDIKSAERTLLRLIDADQMDEQGMKQLVAIYQSQGMNDRSAYKKLYRVISKSLEKRGKKKEAKEYADLAKRV